MSSPPPHNYINKRILCLFILIFSLLITSVLASATAKSINISNKSKRAIDLHPDVWGYDLSDHKLIPAGYSSGPSYRTLNGDVMFRFSRCFKNCGQAGKEKYEYAMLWFFAGKVEFMKDFNSLISYIDKNKVGPENYSHKRAELSNGECIRKIYVETAKLCQVNDLRQNIIIKGQCEIIDKPENIYDYDIITDQSPEIKRYSIIHAGSNALRYIDKRDGLCDRGGPGGGEIIYQQLYPVVSIVDLKDDTFLASWGNLIIRFDRHLKTKFIPKHNIELADDKIIKGNSFVLPYETIEDLVIKVGNDNDHEVQGLQNELLLYLYRRAENK